MAAWLRRPSPPPTTSNRLRLQLFIHLFGRYVSPSPVSEPQKNDRNDVCPLFLLVFVYYLLLYLSLVGCSLLKLKLCSALRPIFLTPVLFFGDGFFLRRVEFPDKSTNHGTPIYKRAVILLVDAMAFTFVKPVTTITSDTEYFANQLTIFQELLESDAYSNKVRLFKFLADPPTTTMQRIKALSTGSLSTFIELAANFFSSEIQEDSWIYQSKTNGNGVVALGDDTWAGLFPKEFSRSFLYPSFNVKDLDTVDNGVLAHLYDELETRDWSVLLAHFLGVDHCGHTYGRNHPEMNRKLKQINGVIRKTIEKIDNDTILFVFGDHGMTANGDHGGDSELEISSALFFYAPKHNLERQSNGHPEIYQTDFIPTISLLLGSPIPFSNIGTLIDDLFVASPLLSDRDRIAAYQANSRQLATFFEKYFVDKTAAAIEIDNAHQLAISKSDSALNCLSLSKTSDDCKLLVKEAVSAHKSFHKTVRSTCEEAWVKFNMTLVFGGLFGMVLAVFILILVFVLLDSENIPSWLLLICILLIATPFSVLVSKVVLKSTYVSDFASIMLLNSILVFICWLFYQRCSRGSIRAAIKGEPVAHCLVLLPLLIGKFSNSFVIYEPYIILLLLNLFVLAKTWRLLAKLLFSLPGKLRHNLLSWPLNYQLLFTICLLALLRFQLFFVSCREEHGPVCEQTSFLSPLGSLVVTGGSYLTFRFFVATLSILAVPVYFCRLASQRGNLKSRSCPGFFYAYGLYLVVMLIIADWVVQAASLKATAKQNLPSSLVILFPRIVYLLVAAFFGFFLLKPLIFAQKSETDVVSERLNEEQLDPDDPAVKKTLFNFLKSKYDQGLDPGVSSLFVYGLGAVISTGWQLIYAVFILIVTMLSGDGLSPAILTVCLVLFFFYKLEMANGIAIAVMVHLLQSFAFFTTGHHATWTHINWQAAFVGFDKLPDFFAIPGALVLTNIFAGNVIAVLSIPLFVLWPVVEMNCLPTVKGNNKKNDSGEAVEQDAECGFLRYPKLLANPLARICLLFVITTGIELVTSSVAACFLRRHLMAYKIFVPRLIFSIISFAYNLPLLLLVSCLPVYILRRLANWKDSIDYD